MGATRLLCLKLFRGSAFPARLPGLAALRFSCTLPTWLDLPMPRPTRLPTPDLRYPMRGTSDVFQWANDGTLWYTLKKVFLPVVLVCFRRFARTKLSAKFLGVCCGRFAAKRGVAKQREFVCANM